MFVRMENILVNQETEDREQVLKQAALDFGRRVKQLRKAAGLTQTDLAERLSQWGRSYHQTTVAKLEAGTRPTTLEELIPLSVALGVPQRQFFEDPSPTDHAERKVREAEQAVVKLRSELSSARTHYQQVQNDLQRANETYAQRLEALRELDPEVVAERQQEAEDLQDIADTLKADQWPL